jgi:alkanesulfonate monooxygenase SsuD/methylene tetrahydromethanopterin reductase-like flavin-dependent oxidoreductase (luciferase family)
MEFAIFTNSSRPNRSVASGIEEDLYEIVTADRLGFREAWVSEHSTPAELLICKAAAVTSRIRLGTGVRPLPIHHPLQLVIEANMCDHMTGGRYMFGLGLGLVTLKDKMRQRGLDYGQARAMMRESIEFILQAWSSPEPFDFNGQFWQGEGIDVQPRPLQQPHPPIAIACSASADTVQLAGERGFIPLFSPTDHPTRLRAAGDAFCAAARAADRDVGREMLRLGRYVYVSDSYEQAKRELEPTLLVAIEQERRFAPHRFDRYLPPSGDSADLTIDCLAAAGRYVIGDPDTVYDRLAEFYEQTGGFGVLMLHMGRDYGTREGRERSLELFCEHVAPRLRRLHVDRTPASATSAAPALQLNAFFS